MLGKEKLIRAVRSNVKLLLQNKLSKLGKDNTSLLSF